MATLSTMGSADLEVGGRGQRFQNIQISNPFCLSYMEILVSKLYASIPLNAEGRRTLRGPSQPVKDICREDPSNTPPAWLPSNRLWFTICHLSTSCSLTSGCSGANNKAIPGFPTFPTACATAHEAMFSGGYGIAQYPLGNK